MWPNGPRMFFMLKNGTEFLTGKVTSRPEDDVLELTLDIPNQETKIRMGYDGGKVIIAILQDEQCKLAHHITVNSEDAS